VQSLGGHLLLSVVEWNRVMVVVVVALDKLPEALVP
jgi:hypothetical protein